MVVVNLLNDLVNGDLKLKSCKCSALLKNGHVDILILIAMYQLVKALKNMLYGFLIFECFYLIFEYNQVKYVMWDVGVWGFYE